MTREPITERVAERVELVVLADRVREHRAAADDAIDALITRLDERGPLHGDVTAAAARSGLNRGTIYNALAKRQEVRDNLSSTPAPEGPADTDEEAPDAAA